MRHRTKASGKAPVYFFFGREKTLSDQTPRASSQSLLSLRMTCCLTFDASDREERVGERADGRQSADVSYTCLLLRKNRNWFTSSPGKSVAFTFAPILLAFRKESPYFPETMGYFSPQGSPSTASQIIRQFVDAIDKIPITGGSGLLNPFAGLVLLSDGATRGSSR